MYIYIWPRREKKGNRFFFFEKRKRNQTWGEKKRSKEKGASRLGGVAGEREIERNKEK